MQQLDKLCNVIQLIMQVCMYESTPYDQQPFMCISAINLTFDLESLGFVLPPVVYIAYYNMTKLGFFCKMGSHVSSIG